MDTMEKIRELHSNGYNCCQIVSGLLGEKMEMDPELMFKISEGFGAGMGRMEGTCGAIVGAVMAAGLSNSAGTQSEKSSTPGTLKIGQEIISAFKEKNGSIICHELKDKGREMGRVGCDECIADALEIAQKVLNLK